MNINLTPEQEEIVKDELRFGRFQTAEEVISTALKALREKGHSPAHSEDSSGRAPYARCSDFVKRTRIPLQGISVKQLIHEGHRL